MAASLVSVASPDHAMCKFGSIVPGAGANAQLLLSQRDGIT
jgi:hypothetical protein